MVLGKTRVLEKEKGESFRTLEPISENFFR